MFSLIVTIISIALVIALAIAVIYYGGDISSRTSIKASAATLLNQAQQINAAGTIATSQGVGWPAASPTFGTPYLSAMPVPPKSAYADRDETPDASHWTYYENPVTPGSAHHFVLKNKISRQVCLAVNKDQGFIGIPAAWDGVSLVQCFGPGVSAREGAEPGYTFFYDPMGTTKAERDTAIDQSLNEGGTSVPGYPRLCPDGSSITEGLCPGSNPTPGNGGSGGSGDPGNPGNPSDPPASNWHFTPGMTTQVLVTGLSFAPYYAEYGDGEQKIQRGNFARYQAVEDCSAVNLDPSHARGGMFCIPAFIAQRESWSGITGEEKVVEDSNGMRTQLGYTLTDGTNTYTFVRNYEEKITRSYLQFGPSNGLNYYPTADGKLQVDCSKIELPPMYQWLGQRCKTMTTDSGWGITYEFDYGVSLGDLAAANPTFHVTKATSGYDSCAGNKCSWHQDSAPQTYAFNFAVKEDYEQIETPMAMVRGVKVGPLGPLPVVAAPFDYTCHGYCQDMEELPEM